MKVWIGHYMDNVKKWFIAWGGSLNELVLVMDGVIGEPDTRSLKRLNSPGFINCHVRFSEGYPYFSLSRDKTLRENWLHVEGTLGRTESVIEYVGRVAQDGKKEEAINSNTKIWLGTYEHKNKAAGEDCFIAWATNKIEATDLICAKTAKSFEKHLSPLLKAGYINIHVSFKSGQMILSPPKEDIENGLWIYMDEYA